MAMMRAKQTLGLLPLLAALAGCCCGPKPAATKQPYVGPTESMDAVVAAVNRNAGRIPTLWSQLDYTAHFVDPKTGKSDGASGDGLLLYLRPMSLFLSGNKDIAGEVFQVGSNPTEFWVKIRSSIDTSNYWWGRYADLTRASTKALPIRPDLVIEVLGVGLYSTNFLEQPVPVMRFDNAADAYVFDFNVRAPDRWVTQKEVWYDRRTKLPQRIVLYDEQGRAVLSADLSKFAGVRMTNVAEADQPQVATHYDLRFPDTGSTMTLDLDAPSLNHALRRGSVPNANSFARPEPEGGDHVIPIGQAAQAR